MKQHQVIDGKTVIYLVEDVIIVSDEKQEKIQAKIDTGATRSSIDTRLAEDLQLGPVIKSKYVKSAQGKQLRPVVEVTIVIANKEITSEFTIADRAQLKYPMLIGQNVLKENFLVDPQ